MIKLEMNGFLEMKVLLVSLTYSHLQFLDICSASAYVLVAVISQNVHI